MRASLMTFFDGFLSENCSNRTHFDSVTVVEMSNICQKSIFASFNCVLSAFYLCKEFNREMLNTGQYNVDMMSSFAKNVYAVCIRYVKYGIKFNQKRRRHDKITGE